MILLSFKQMDPYTEFIYYAFLCHHYDKFLISPF